MRTQWRFISIPRHDHTNVVEQQRRLVFFPACFGLFRVVFLLLSLCVSVTAAEREQRCIFTTVLLRSAYSEMLNFNI